MASQSNTYAAREFAALERIYEAGNCFAAIEAVLLSRVLGARPPEWAADAAAGAALGCIALGVPGLNASSFRYRRAYGELGAEPRSGRWASPFVRWRADLVDAVRWDQVRIARETQRRIGRRKTEAALMDRLVPIKGKSGKPDRVVPHVRPALRASLGRSEDTAIDHAHRVLWGEHSDAGVMSTDRSEPFPDLMRAARGGRRAIADSWARVNTADRRSVLPPGYVFLPLTVASLDKLNAFTGEPPQETGTKNRR